MSDRAEVQNKSAGRPIDLEATVGSFSDLFARQSELPNLVVAEQELLRSVTDLVSAVDRDQKLGLIRAIARGDRENFFGGLPAHRIGSRPSGPAFDSQLFAFALKLSSSTPFISHHDIDLLTAQGLDLSSVIEMVAAVAMARFFATLAKAVGPEFQTEPIGSLSNNPQTKSWTEVSFLGKPYVQMPQLEPDELKVAHARLREQFGFIPNLFRIQSYCPAIVKAEVGILEILLFSEDHLSRVQKELILVRMGALNFDTYLVTVHSQILGLLGIPTEECDQVIDNLDCAHVSAADRVLLEEVSKLSLFSTDSQSRFNCDRLRENEFTEPQIMEAVAMAAFANLLSIVQFGLGPLPDFLPRRVFDPKDLYPFGADVRPNSDEIPVDPDSSIVSQVKQGNTEVFAELVRRHTRRVFGTLLGLVGNVDDARDSTQEVFLKAFRNIRNFQGRSKFSTWITSIAVNTGTELLRQRRTTESLDETDEESGFRPRQIQSWVEDPEQQLAKAQMNDLVRKGVLGLPEKYRVAILLRDINQLPTDEAAAALNLSVPALKARVLRGRLMLRESLAPHFTRAKADVDV
jgi:RNA polymerase sigma-70 factor (ECF subfamily)